jgi:hypothetical protein
MSADLALRVIMLGLCGVPNVQGGEAHAEHFCSWLKELGCDIEVIVRSSYMPPNHGDEWKGVRYHPALPSGWSRDVAATPLYPSRVLVARTKRDAVPTVEPPAHPDRPKAPLG